MNLETKSMMESSDNPKVLRRTITSLEYKWPIDWNGVLRNEPSCYSPIFTTTSSQSVIVEWRVKCTNFDSYRSTIGLQLYASSKHVSSIRLSFAFEIGRIDDDLRNEFKIKTYNFGNVSRDGWVPIGKRSTLYVGRDEQMEDLPILCAINIVDETFADYAAPSCCLAQNLGTILTTGKNADITLVSKDNIRKIQVHKAILVARSPVFDAMLNSEMSECHNKLVVLGDLEADVLDELVRFIYTGKVSNLPTTARRLLQAADKYDLPTLLAICEQEIGSKLSVENAAETLVLADMHQAKELKKHTVGFIVRQAQHVLATEGWQQIEAKYPSLVIPVCQALAKLQPRNP